MEEIAEWSEKRIREHRLTHLICNISTDDNDNEEITSLTFGFSNNLLSPPAGTYKIEPFRPVQIPDRHISQLEFFTDKEDDSILKSLELLDYESEVIAAFNYTEEEKNKRTLDIGLGERIYAVKVASKDDKVISMHFLLVKDTENMKRSTMNTGNRANSYWKSINNRVNLSFQWQNDEIDPHPILKEFDIYKELEKVTMQPVLSPSWE